MLALLKPILAKAWARSRRPLSKTLEGATEWARKSPATSTTAQWLKSTRLDGRSACWGSAPLAGAGPCSIHSAAPPSATPIIMTRAMSLFLKAIPCPSQLPALLRALETPDQLNMRRPEELVYRGDGADPVAARNEQGGIVGETFGVAGNLGDDRDFGLGQRYGLAPGAGAGRVQHHGAIGSQFHLRQRQFEQIADFGGD